jgi:WD repeat-containing protein 23
VQYIFPNDQTNLIITAGEDCLVKLWDKRILSGNNRHVGIFYGHAEGVSHVTSKGDGIFIASNGKD